MPELASSLKRAMLTLRRPLSALLATLLAACARSAPTLAVSPQPVAPPVVPAAPTSPGVAAKVDPIFSLGDRLKSGQTRSPQNRPTDWRARQPLLYS